MSTRARVRYLARGVDAGRITPAELTRLCLAVVEHDGSIILDADRWAVDPWPVASSCSLKVSTGCGRCSDWLRAWVAWQLDLGPADPGPAPAHFPAWVKAWHPWALDDTA